MEELQKQWKYLVGLKEELAERDLEDISVMVGKIIDTDPYTGKGIYKVVGMDKIGPMMLIAWSSEIHRYCWEDTVTVVYRGEQPYISTYTNGYIR